MNIGDAAKITGNSAKMIRHYEAIGLIPSPRRSEAGYRHYSKNDLHALRFVRRARDLGFSIAQIRELLALWQDRERASADVKRIAETHIAELGAKIAQIEGMVSTLQHLSANCHGDDRPDCPIIDELAIGEAGRRQGHNGAPDR